MLILLLACFLSVSLADDCVSCIGNGHNWCVEQNKCQAFDCKTEIRLALNCPMYPKAGFEYDDDFARNVATPAMAAMYIHEPSPCLKNQLPSAVVYQTLYAPCSQIGPNTTCYVYTAYDPTKKAIWVAFRGTVGQTQMDEEIESFFEKKEAFFDNGHVYKFFYDAFYLMWHQGLETAVRQLKYNYPDYNLWVFGHSLGGAMAAVCNAHILKSGLYPPERVRMITYGQPRTGDKVFAEWFDHTALFAYRVIHSNDIVPHIPPRGLSFDGVWHHRYEVWYNNNMTVGQSYQLCAEDDGFYCSNNQVGDKANWDDHDWYFDRSLGNWGKTGCKN